MKELCGGLINTYAFHKGFNTPMFINTCPGDFFCLAAIKDPLKDGVGYERLNAHSK